MNPSKVTSGLPKPRLTIGAMLGGIALLAATLAFTRPMILWIIDAMDDPFRWVGLLAIELKVGPIVLNSQLFYWCFVIPLIQPSRGRRR